jgi:hypothetical protein
MKHIIIKINEIKKHEHLRNSITVFVALGGIGLSQVLKGIIVGAFPEFLVLFFLFQFCGSTLQGYWSDVFKRSNIFNSALLIAIIFSTILCIFHDAETSISIYIKWICIISIATWGNADVVGRAEIIDIRYRMDRRKVMSWTVFSEAFSWVVVGGLIRYCSLSPIKILAITIPYSFILFLISSIFNNDKTHDDHHKEKIKENLFPAIKKSVIPFIIILLGELGYFFFFYNQIHDIEKKPLLLADSYLAWFIGMSLGCIFLSKCKRGGDYLFTIIGLLISIISLFLFESGGMQNIIIPDRFWIDVFVFGVAGFGSGVYLPCFYSIISRGKSIHIQGALIGLIDSIRVLGDLITNGVLLILIVFPFYFPMSISGVLFIISIFILLLYKKNKAQNQD